MNHPVWPTVGVVIPVYNDWQRLQLCLQALAQQTYPAERWRVRVVDNGSDDWPAEPVFPLPVEVLRCPQPGSYAARNLAALGWDVDVLAFTDADCRPEPDWLLEGLACLDHAAHAADLVAGAIRLTASRAVAPTAAEQLDQILGFDQGRTVRRAGYGATANLFVRASVFHALGGFQSQTRSGADRDLCARALRMGSQLVYAPRARVGHPARGWLALVQKQRRIVGGQLALAPPGACPRLIVLALSMRPLASESWRLLRAPGLHGWRRWELLLLAFRLRLAVLLEWVRLQWPGQQPLR
jgi:glycosyltransferase involved in cell wall biosynthesis